MKITTILGLGAVGAALYAHKRHGGDFTLDSFKKSARDLFAYGKAEGEKIADAVKQEVSRGQETVRNGLPDVGLSGYKPRH